MVLKALNPTRLLPDSQLSILEKAQVFLSSSLSIRSGVNGKTIKCTITVAVTMEVPKPSMLFNSQLRWWDPRIAYLPSVSKRKASLTPTCKIKQANYSAKLAIQASITTYSWRNRVRSQSIWRLKIIWRIRRCTSKSTSTGSVLEIRVVASVAISPNWVHSLILSFKPNAWMCSSAPVPGLKWTKNER